MRVAASWCRASSALEEETWLLTTGELRRSGPSAAIGPGLEALLDALAAVQADEGPTDLSDLAGVDLARSGLPNGVGIVTGTPTAATGSALASLHGRVGALSVVHVWDGDASNTYLPPHLRAITAGDSATVADLWNATVIPA